MIKHNRLERDHHRPTYHFLPPADWMNDPNGLIQWKGTYHLFYQYNPHGAFWGTMHWGHAMSEDLVHWTHLPVALAPSPDGPDADGCFSGVAVDVDGVPTLMYTGVRGDLQLPCIATSSDDDLSSWHKYEGNPVIGAPPAGLATTIFRDHSVWREDGTWYQVIGSGVEGIGGTALLYRSRDFFTWEFVDSLVSLDRVGQGIGEGATGWECPDFFALDGRHVLVAAMWDQDPICVGYYVGDYADHRFTPEREGIVDPGVAFYAPQSFTDDAGRRVMFGWITESRSVQAQRDAGWSGVMTLPRVLSVRADGSLGSAPAPETQVLRGEHVRIQGDQLVPGQVLDLATIPGDALELLLTFDRDVTGSAGIDVLCSPDGLEKTSIAYDADTQALSLDTLGSSRSGDAIGGVYRVHHAREGDEPVQLRVFVDHSVIEVFLNDETCITGRAYPRSSDSVSVMVWRDLNSSTLQAIDIWSMDAH